MRSSTSARPTGSAAACRSTSPRRKAGSSAPRVPGPCRCRDDARASAVPERQHVVGIYWLKAAAAKDDPRAMLVYGTALFNGDGVKPDRALGYAYVSRAAAQGLAPARDTLAQMDAVLSPDERSKAAGCLPARSPARRRGAKAAGGQSAARQKSPPAKIASAPASRRARSVRCAGAAASGDWRIQLGAFSQRSSAEALFRKLAGSSALAGRSPAYVPAGAVIRLQVGPFESRAAAARACSCPRRARLFPGPGEIA